jgi:hypothetical protein
MVVLRCLDPLLGGGLSLWFTVPPGVCTGVEPPFATAVVASDMFEEYRWRPDREELRWVVAVLRVDCVRDGGADEYDRSRGVRS